MHHKSTKYARVKSDFFMSSTSSYICMWKNDGGIGQWFGRRSLFITTHRLICKLIKFQKFRLWSNIQVNLRHKDIIPTPQSLIEKIQIFRRSFNNFFWFLESNFLEQINLKFTWHLKQIERENEENSTFSSIFCHEMQGCVIWTPY
jgi:hypothetical protein